MEYWRVFPFFHFSAIPVYNYTGKRKWIISKLVTPVILISYARSVGHSAFDAESSLYASLLIARSSRAMTK
jgi:hypothetical protein